jgi:glycosyltransferase involved in cell wall biosynthesis
MYENCVAYVFPSLSEGFGLPGLEAMAHGAPVISSNATCLPEVYGDAAYYFYPYHTKEIANAIEEVVNNKKLRDELVVKGKVQVKKYSWRRMAEQTLEVYKKALGEN